MHVSDVWTAFVQIIAFARNCLIPFNEGANHFSLFDFWYVTLIMSWLYFFLWRVLGIEIGNTVEDMHDTIF